MDYDQAAVLLRSEDTDKQLAALHSIFPIITTLPPCEEFLTALIERGLSCEKSHLVRQLSFQCISLLYNSCVTRWGDVRAAISAEFGTAESPECLVAAIQVLYNLPITELVNLVGSKDMMSVMKGCLQAPNSSIVATAVENLAPLLIDTWLYVHSTNSVEGIVVVESTAEARRFRDDILDFVGEVFKGFALGAVGKAPAAEVNQQLPDNSRPVGSYFSALADLMERYFACYEEVHIWTSSLLGCVLPTPPPRGDADPTSRSASLALLMRQVLPTLLADPYLLFARYQQMPFHTGVLSCVSHTVLALLLALPGENGESCLGYAASLVFEEKASLQFGSDLSEDDTAASRAMQLEINIVKIAEVCCLVCFAYPLIDICVCVLLIAPRNQLQEWLLHHLMGTAIKSVLPGEVTLAVYSALSMLQSSVLIHRRTEVSTPCHLDLNDAKLYHQTFPVILENIHRIMQHGPVSVPDRSERIDGYQTCPDYHKLIPWALRACRFVPRASLGEFLPSLIEQICTRIPDDVSRSKLFAEVAALLLMDMEDSGGVAHPEVLYGVLSHAFVIRMLQTEAPTASGPTSQPHSFMRERLLLSLCRAVKKAVPVAIAYVLSAVQMSGGFSSYSNASLADHTAGEDAFGAPVMTLPGAPSESPPSADGILPISGMGRYVVSSDGSEGRPGDAESVGRAVKLLENALACAMFVLRSCHK